MHFPLCILDMLDVQADHQKKKKKRKSSHGGHGAQQNDIDEGTYVAMVDANEPTYCTCKRISSGNMVACDNPECLIEWFHYECVGLTGDPPDPWFCPACASTESTVSTDVAESGKVKIEPTAGISQLDAGEKEIER